ncbi:hypothetical protein H6P81_015314 [Aristolochia fimbriata]|uniref:non-specific serine/threonine protein kinase n=1 Tax=Aristolochia fimbriata TaxID=158543 RepID=A0AAV7E598_ARIFI|nr:hypothetical protein H6P81_015314 [Aristolochia fimbriata]
MGFRPGGCGFLCFVLLLSFHFYWVSAAVSKGSTLRPTDPNPFWESPNGTFALGFLPSAQSSSSYVFSVAYSTTPIWVPTETVVDRSATFHFADDGNLRLLNGSGFAVWESKTSNIGITTAVLDDSGNLALKNASSFTLWQSFDHPTDTILQSQNFTRSMVLRSRPYSFSLASSGNLTLTWNSRTLYWNRGLNSTIDSNRSLVSPSLTLQPVGLLYLYDSSLSSEVNLAYCSNYGEYGDFIRFLRLDSDGNLRAYSAERGDNSPAVQWSAVSDQCEVFGWCGNMGICTYNDSSPVCKCPSQNFEFTDPNDPRQGCKRKQEIDDCPGSSTMLALENTEFLTYPPDTTTQVYFAGSTACRSNCLIGPCIASTSLADGTGMCYLKISGFVSGYQSPSIPSTSFVKVCPPAISNNSPASGSQDKNKSSKLEAWLVALVVLATILSLVIIEFGLWWWFCRNNTKFGGLSAQYALLDGRRNFDISMETGGKKFSVWAYEEFDKGNMGSILDPRLADQEVDMDELGRAVQVSFWCIQEQPSQRPSMGKVVQMLEGIMLIEKPPAPKATESSIGSVSASASGSVGALSTFAASAPVPSSTSSAQVVGWSSHSGRNMDNSSSLRRTG